MSRLIRFAIGGACITLVTLLSLRLPGVPQAPPPKTTANPEDPLLSRLEERLDSLTDDVGDLRDEQDALGTDVLALAADVPGADEGGEEATPATDSTEWNRRRAASFDARMGARGGNPAWSKEAEAALTTRFSRPEGDVALTAVRCAATLCRVDAQLAGPEAADWLMESGPLAVGWDNHLWAHVDALGHALLYVSREGHDLPPLPA